MTIKVTSPTILSTANKPLPAPEVCSSTDGCNKSPPSSLGSLEKIGLIGLGGFGSVELVKDDDNVYALKTMTKAHIKNTGQEAHVLSEREVLLSVDCPHVVKLHSTFRDAEKLYMLMEPCLGGELYSLIRKEKRLPEAAARYYVASIVKAFEYLHARGIVYRDLKPENVLLDECGRPKLCDFGFAKNISADGKTYTFCGTPEYAAPETISAKGQSTAVDLWALGIFVYECLTGNPPFISSDPMNVYRGILRGMEHLVWPRYLSKSAVDLILALCKMDPAERLGFAGIRSHPWFEGFDWELFEQGRMPPPYEPQVSSPIDTNNFAPMEHAYEFPSEVDESGWDEEFA